MLFSIIIPCYNSEKYLTQCLASVMLQTEKSFEILIGDDFSSDGTQEIIADFVEKCPSKIRVFRNSKNLGAGVTRSKLLNSARGDYLAFLDSDDFWDKDKLHRCRSYIELHSPDIMYHNLCLVDHHANNIGELKCFTKFKKFQIFLRNPFPTSGSVVAASVVMAKNMPSLRRRQDYAYWLRIMKNNSNMKVMKVPGVLGSYRKRRNSLSSNKFINVRYNFLAFRFAGYSVLSSVFCVSLNVADKVFRRFVP